MSANLRHATVPWIVCALTGVVGMCVAWTTMSLRDPPISTVLPTIPKALAAEAGTHISAPHAVSGTVMSQADIDQQALTRFKDATLRESALVYLDDDVVRPAIHSNVWAVSLMLPQGSGILPNPQTGEWTKLNYFLAVFDAQTGQFLFAESQ